MEKLVSRRRWNRRFFIGFQVSFARSYVQRERERERAIDPMLEALAAHRLILLSNLHSNPVLHAIYVSLHFAWTDIPANFFSSTRGGSLLT